ncbi:hypothetical protein HUU51_02480 [Candidatus Gracilibacteria bacterium]|nr:hypothetical protein [Candidatus Gracilibacteria bacterium]
MGGKFPNLIEFETEQEYKELFISEYIEKEFKTHDGIIIKVQEGHFEHIFYRDKGTPNVYFDKWLARRILFLRPIVENVTGNIEIYDGPNFKSKRDERSYIYVYGKICIFLGKMGNGNFFPITAYQKNNKELERIRKSKNIKRIV